VGVSTPGNDISIPTTDAVAAWRAITVAGNPPVKFASTSFEAENDTRSASFPLFLARSSCLTSSVSAYCALPKRGDDLRDLSVCLLRLGGHPIASAVIALILVEVALVLLSVAIKRASSATNGGLITNPVLVLAPLHLLLAQDCFFVLVPETAGVLPGTVLANSILRWMDVVLAPGPS